MTLTKNKAVQAMLQGDWKNAASLNKTILRENPEDINALNRLAFVFTSIGKVKDAKITYKKVLKLDALNQIAMRNIKKLINLSPKKIKNNKISSQYVNYTFIEETGKTKIVSLVNIAQPKIIALLTTGQPLAIIIKRSKIFIQDLDKQYLGVLPDDIGKRLIKLMKGGNAYSTCVRSASQRNVSIFVKEVKRASRYKNQPSFLPTPEKDLSLTKDKIKIRNPKENQDEDDDKSYFSEEEMS